MKLSICIPTYNRARFLGDTLNAFLPLLDRDVQIVISDNASTDGTAEIVDNFRRRFPQVTYHRWEQNMGASRNYLKVVELAEGDYCWLFGSDDIPTPDSMALVRESMASNCDIALFNWIWCDFQMKPFRKVRCLDQGIGPATFHIGSAADLRSYLQRVQCVAGLFSYLSAIVFRRIRWDQSPYDDRFTGGAYSHSAKLLSILREGADLRYDPRIVVNCRHGNDSFATEGMFKRVMIDLDGYGAIRDILFPGDPEVAKQINRILRQDYPWWYIAKLKGGIGAEDFQIMLAAFRAIDYPAFPLRTAERLGEIIPLWRLLLFLKIRVWIPLRRWFL